VDNGGALAVPQPAEQIVGVVLVRNDDLFVEQAIRNVASFCDRIHAFDHVSTDRTPEILRSLERQYAHLDVKRTRQAAESHRALERYAGTRTWILGVDGDELYDPGRLGDFRRELLTGAFDDAFKVASNVLNCVEVDREARTATGYLSPPSRSITKLYNYAAIDSWEGDGSERLHGGTILFKPGYDEGAVENISERLTWEQTPLRCLHVCFVRRSSRDAEAELRPILMESGMHDRSWRGALKRRLLRLRPPEESAWKREKYMRGELVTVDASPFL
jgi:hypothetical protein